jgi:CheY-like chemotaxis protein
MARRKRNRVSGAVLIIEANEAYQAVIETCLRLTGCRAEAVTDLELALPKLEKLRSARRTGSSTRSLRRQSAAPSRPWHS